MLGLSFGEILLLLLVGLVVVGPRRLPTMMRTAGQWVGKLRRMSTELRAQSGIDEIIRQEGLEREISELRALSRVNVIDTIVTPVISGAAAPPRPKPPPPPPARKVPPRSDEPLREREYPLLGCDAYDALPEEIPAAPEPARPPQDAAGADESRPAS